MFATSLCELAHQAMQISGFYDADLTHGTFMQKVWRVPQANWAPLPSLPPLPPAPTHPRLCLPQLPYPVMVHADGVVSLQKVYQKSMQPRSGRQLLILTGQRTPRPSRNLSLLAVRSVAMAQYAADHRLPFM